MDGSGSGSFKEDLVIWCKGGCDEEKSRPGLRDARCHIRNN